MEYNVYMPFKTSNAEYLYDDETGIIHLWSEVRQNVLDLYNHYTVEQICDLLADKHSREEIEKAYYYIDYQKGKYGAFHRQAIDRYVLLSNLDEQLIKDTIRKVNSGLLISLTDECNLRCKYCIYSEIYPNRKMKSSAFLSLENILKGINMYLDFVKDAITYNPRKVYTISFYGGEPLLRAENMFATIDYVNSQMPGRFVFTFTTNGTKLSQSVCQNLAERKVNMFVSLDGPHQQHDRLRVDIRGNGTYNRIFNMIQKLQQNHPQYFKEHVHVISVFDPATDIVEVDRFFQDINRNKVLPMPVMVSPVNDRDTSYYQQFSQNVLLRHRENYNYLHASYLKCLTEGVQPTAYSKSLIGPLYLTIALRARHMDIPPTKQINVNSCFPGSKLFLDTNGTLQICERVNGSNPIGSLDGGLDYSSILELLLNYNREILPHCMKCPVSRICSNCFLAFERNGFFQHDKEICTRTKSLAMKLLTDYAHLGECNPNFRVLTGTEEVYFSDEFANT